MQFLYYIHSLQTCPRAAQHRLERLTRSASRGLETHFLLQMTGNCIFQGGLYIQWYDVQTGVFKNMVIPLYRSITTEKRTDGRAHVCGWKNKTRSKWKDPWRKTGYVGRGGNTGIPSHLPTLVYLSASTEVINTNNFNEKTSRNVCLAMLRCKYLSFAKNSRRVNLAINVAKPVGQ
jgi:hypothetical protein